ncbi:potassium channel family protein [Vreelandella zhaodongensis]|uniref:potassium channel family protein n=1 Tax=Vreelandella zhaodongensis TaxID=1176240 RepID=UPI003EB994DE
MPVLQQLLKALKASTINVSWTFLLLLALAHMATSWLLMCLTGEEVTGSLALWLYFYVVTASTVGYGDFSPTSTAGQLVAALYLIPGGISLFAALIGKATVTVSHFWRQQMQGKGDYSDLTGHTVVLGCLPLTMVPLSTKRGCTIFPKAVRLANYSTRPSRRIMPPCWE